MADPDDHLDIIRAYLQEHGTGRRQDFIRLLGLEPEQGTLLLRRLTDRGERVLTGGITPCRSRRNDLRFAPKTPKPVKVRLGRFVTFKRCVNGTVLYKNAAFLHLYYIPAGTIYIRKWG